MKKESMTSIAKSLAISTSTVIRKLKEFTFKTDLNKLPTHMSWDEYSFKKGKTSFIAQVFDSRSIVTILDGRSQATIRNKVKVITMDMFSPYYDIAKKLFPKAKIVLDRFHIMQNLSRAMNRLRIQIMNRFDRKTIEYRSLKRYWKLILLDSRKLNDKRKYHAAFQMHLTNQEILKRLLSYSEELKEHYQLLLFHFQEKQEKHFFDLITERMSHLNPIFISVFRTFLKDKDKIINALELPYSNAKLEATNNLIKVFKRNAFGFRNFDNFKKRILIALNIKKEKTCLVFSRCEDLYPLQLTKSHNIFQLEKQKRQDLETLSFKVYRRPGSNRHVREDTGF